MKIMKKNKTIDSILQITKNVVCKNNNYYDYIVNENNSLYNKQLPLLMKNNRINSLVLSKPKLKEKDIVYQSTKNSSQKEEIYSEINYESDQYISPLNNIRTLKTRSPKLPPLSPIFNSRGILLPSIVNSRRNFLRNILKKENSMNEILKLPNSVDIERNSNRILKGQKIKLKKIKYNLCLNSVDLNYNHFKIKNLNEPRYNNLIYDESKIFGYDKYYREIIKNKIIELQTIYNKNLTIKKEKTYKYGLHKKKLNLTLDSLKIRLNEVKDESSFNIQVYEKPVFEYTFPFALLPLFYYKDAETFLIILTKLIIWDEDTQSFKFVKKDDEVIANILKNCDDYYISDNDKSFISSNLSFMDEKEASENDSNILDMIFEGKINSRNKNNNNQINDINNNNNKNNNSNPLTKSFNSLHKNSPSKNSKDNNSSTLDIKNYYKSFDVYPKIMQVEPKSISTFEYFWLTPKKSFILTIETPLITVEIPSNNSIVKKYIDFDLLFYMYSKNFVMWDFYIINYLFTYKNFREFLDNIYSIPEKRNISFYITQPKKKVNLFTFYELTSIITRETKRKSPVRQFYSPKKENEKNDFNFYNSNENIDNKIGTKDKNVFFNSTFIQKGLLAVATFIDTENKIYNEYTFHFNLDHLRKFQVMEMFVNKLSFFLKFLKIDYENKTISFDFDSFNEFNEFNWIENFNKYNINYIKLLQQKIATHIIKPKMSDEFPGIDKGTKIKIEIKCPLILMRALDENGFVTTETVNVDHRVEKILSNIIIHNAIDLTRQLVIILRDNNFCRKIYVSKRALTKKMDTNKRKFVYKNDFSLNKLINHSPIISMNSLGIVPDIGEE